MDNSNERKITFNGDLFQMTSNIVYSKKDSKIKIYEKAHRPPGVRMIITENDKILLTREFRPEIQNWDYRLPGGKVYDHLSEYLNAVSDSCRFDDDIKKAVVLETEQETGLIVGKHNLSLVHKSVAGASVIWDLFYFEVKEFEYSQTGQKLEEGEEIDPPVWKSFEEVLTMCLNGQIKEDRSVAVLFRYIHNKTNKGTISESNK